VASIHTAWCGRMAVARGGIRGPRAAGGCQHRSDKSRRTGRVQRSSARSGLSCSSSPLRYSARHSGPPGEREGCH